MRLNSNTILIIGGFSKIGFAVTERFFEEL
jgi:short-subunit dehydrogenase involved in D-alanine esterification of teichoic acids